MPLSQTLAVLDAPEPNGDQAWLLGDDMEILVGVSA
jgi:hypothetical protein